MWPDIWSLVDMENKCTITGDIRQAIKKVQQDGLDTYTSNQTHPQSEFDLIKLYIQSNKPVNVNELNATTGSHLLTTVLECMTIFRMYHSIMNLLNSRSVDYTKLFKQTIFVTLTTLHCWFMVHMDVPIYLLVFQQSTRETQSFAIFDCHEFATTS
jgi:hypothetical protein